MAERDNQWHLSKSIPLSLIFAMVVQAAGIIWYVSQVDYQVKNNKEDILKMEIVVDSLETSVNDQAVQLGRIEENVTATRKTLERLERKLDGQRF